MPLDRPPVIRVSLVVQMPDTSNMRGVALCLRPIDCCFLSAKSAKHLVALGLDHIVIDARPFRTAFRPGFNVDGCHNLISFCFETVSFRAYCALREGWALIAEISLCTPPSGGAGGM